VRVIFFGTPIFAVPTLTALNADPRFDVSLVVTQPDRPAGRGRVLETPPVARAAAALNVPVYQPSSLRDPASRQPLVAIEADLFVVAAYGLIFGSKTLAVPALGCVNVHASLLPRFRGATPIPAAIMSGDRDTGVTLIQMGPGLDTGPILAAAPLPLRERDTTETLTERMAQLGASLALDALPAFAAGELVPVPQPRDGASLTRPLTKADGWLDWTAPAQRLERQVRAMLPWPRAWTTLGAEPLQVFDAALDTIDASLPPGTIVIDRDGMMVACGEEALRLLQVQPAGGKRMSAASYVAGKRHDMYPRLGLQGSPPPQPPLITEL